jgi:hypothetical protein
MVLEGGLHEELNIYIYIYIITLLPWRQCQDLGRTEFGKVFLDTVAKPIYITRITRGTALVELQDEDYLKYLHMCSICDPEKIFLASKFSYLLFPSPLIKLKLGLQIGGTATSKQGTAVISYLLQSSSLALLCLLPANFAKILGQNHVAERNR